MDLYLQRHGIATLRGTGHYAHDSERPLTGKGIKRMRRIASGMKCLGLEFELILSSPFLRARQTAEIVAQTFRAKKSLELTALLEVGADTEALVAELTSRDVRSVLLVGHEPFLSTLISILVTGNARADVTMKKGGLARLAIDTMTHGQCATLEWLMTPAQMVRLR